MGRYTRGHKSPLSSFVRPPIEPVVAIKPFISNFGTQPRHEIGTYPLSDIPMSTTDTANFNLDESISQEIFCKFSNGLRKLSG